MKVILFLSLILSIIVSSCSKLILIRGNFEKWNFFQYEYLVKHSDLDPYDKVHSYIINKIITDSYESLPPMYRLYSNFNYKIISIQIDFLEKMRINDRITVVGTVIGRDYDTDTIAIYGLKDAHRLTPNYVSTDGNRLEYSVNKISLGYPQQILNSCKIHFKSIIKVKNQRNYGINFYIDKYPEYAQRKLENYIYSICGM